MKSLSKKSQPPKRKDKMKKFFQNKELPISKNFKRKRLLKSSKLKRWSKNSLLPKPSKRLKLPLPKKLLPKPTSPDWRESMNCQEEKPRPSFRCWRLSNKWRPSKLLSLKNKNLLNKVSRLRRRSSWVNCNKSKLRPNRKQLKNRKKKTAQTQSARVILPQRSY